MVKYNIDQSATSNMAGIVEDYAVGAMQTDGANEQRETEWVNTKWTQYWGYFNQVPDLKSAILMKAIWNVGKGYTVKNKRFQTILDNIKGWGKDTFEDIIFNMEIIRRVGGDSYAEIIRNDNGTLINLKPLDPGSIRHIVNRKGIIKRYEQFNKVGNKTKVINKFPPEDIFHLSNNRLADQIHGISDIESLEPVILAEEENFADMKMIAHRQARPLIMFKLQTDIQSKIDSFIAKMDVAVNKGENIYVPDDKNAVDWEVIQVNVSSVIMAWRNDIRNKFYRTIGLPQIVPGGGGQSTESESKVIYLAFEQIVEKDQRYIEKQIWNQLAIKINFIPPATLSQQLQGDEAKDGALKAAQPSDTQVPAPQPQAPTQGALL